MQELTEKQLNDVFSQVASKFDAVPGESIALTADDMPPVDGITALEEVYGFGNGYLEDSSAFNDYQRDSRREGFNEKTAELRTAFQSRLADFYQEETGVSPSSEPEIEAYLSKTVDDYLGDLYRDDSPYMEVVEQAVRDAVQKLGLTLGQVDEAQENLVPFRNVLNGTLEQEF